MLQRVVTLRDGRTRAWRSEDQKLLEAAIDAERPASHMFNLSWDVFTEAGLVLGQHFQQRPQVEPPLGLWHAVPAEQRHEFSHTHRTVFLRDDLLKVSVRLKLSDRDEGDDLPVEAQHTRRVWRVGKHAT